MPFTVSRRRSFRIFLMREARRASPENARLVRRVLNDDDLFSACQDAVEENYTENAQGKWTDFFQWLLDHSDEILALVMKIIELFSQGEDVTGAAG